MWTAPGHRECTRVHPSQQGANIPETLNDICKDMSHKHEHDCKEFIGGAFATADNLSAQSGSNLCDWKFQLYCPHGCKIK